MYRERALGLVKKEKEIIDKIISLMPFEVSAVQKENVLYAREERMKNALRMVSKEILDVLQKLESKDIKLGLISNAGLLKPDRQIYELAMQRLNVSPEQCLFVGDGGSNELYGTKSAGMGTVFSEMLEIKSSEQRKDIMKYADHHVRHLNELFHYL